MVKIQRSMYGLKPVPFKYRDTRNHINETLKAAQAVAGFVEVVVFFGEAEAEKVFSAAGAEEGAAGHRGYAGSGEELAGFFSGGFARQAGGVGQDVVSACRGGGS